MAAAAARGMTRTFLGKITLRTDAHWEKPSTLFSCHCFTTIFTQLARVKHGCAKQRLAGSWHTTGVELNKCDWPSPLWRTDGLVTQSPSMVCLSFLNNSIRYLLDGYNGSQKLWKPSFCSVSGYRWDSQDSRQTNSEFCFQKRRVQGHSMETSSSKFFC